MVKNWSKIVLVSLLVIAIAAPAFATTARVRSLANTGDYLSDDSNVFRWYSTLPSYANMVQAEIGTWNGYYFTGPAQPGMGYLNDTRGLGFNYACGEDGKWGTYRITLNENAVDHPGFYLVNPLISMFSQTGADVPTPYWVTPVNKWDLAGGWEIGESVVLGLAYTRSSFSTEDDQSDPTLKITSSWSTFGLGFTWTNNENLILDAALTYATAGGKYEVASTTPTNLEWDKSTGIEIAARMFYDWKDYVTVVPLFDYVTSEYAMALTPTPPGPLSVPNGDKMSAILVGAALDLEVNGSNTLIFAAEYVSASWEQSNADTAAAPADPTEATASVFPVFRLALESEITSWLTTRVGATHSNISYTEKQGAEIKYTNQAYIPGEGWVNGGFEWFLGAGFNVAEWTIDMELAPEVLFSMGWWLHGYTAFDDADYGPIYRISGTYNF
jgi:hypothetical protein